MWQIHFTKKAEKDFSKLTPEIRKRIDRAIVEKLQTAPEKYLVPLAGDLTGFYKFRVGDYRLLCAREGVQLVVTVVRVAHRREVYS
ncbi:MAG: hypothetical protein A2887_01870 [Alphaproteobacteria bacterium RIFCSPLOWO2_01_FULL_40_26]|nr:MAG: hypothetical protein A3D15_01835 [Alphaproteobacteria bacterium RIFCSPHIGHO2_02_FULL_40_34]OFW95022.1 MAG: hypothetical protein A2887_01870 [Alphaproteobacteria bacterium RIFCSPLOWO2_01_FULL_40_26]OFX10529.1 MAG: hypothetical protein A3H30_02320 [Alphaproteobacteria bacterium RIFCSPLOWO2_02_FULL_40_19]OFX12105.1 MAG: hypothetical protein A3G22_03200 [Alphaproteobacteria bacterium RIFCSPLOWO2_12_FULL_40_11]